MASEDVNLRIALKDEISSGLSGIAKSIGAIGLAYLSWSTVKNVIGGIVTATREDEQATITLDAAMKRHGITLGDWKDKIDKASLATINLTGTSDELYKRGLSRMINLGVPVATAMTVMTTAMDAAKYSGESLESTASMLGKAFNGITRGVQQYGLKIDDSLPKAEKFAQVVKQLNANFGGSAQADMMTYDGQLKRMKESIDNVAEAFGKGVRVTALLAAAFAEISVFAQNVPMMFGNATQFVRDFFGAISTVATKTLDTISTVITAMAAFAEGPGAGAAGLPAALQQIKQNAADVGAAFLKVGTDAVLGIGQAVNVAVLMNSAAEDVLKNFGEANQKALKPFLQNTAELDAMLKSMGTDFDRAMEFFIPFNEAAKNFDETIKSMGTDFDRAMMCFDKFKNAGKKGLNELSTLSKGFASAIGKSASKGIDNISEELWKLRVETSSVFGNMAQDFVFYFIDEVLRQVAQKLVTKLLIMLKLFDVPANDRMAMQMGRDYGTYFTRGAVEAMTAGAAEMAGAAAFGGQSQRYIQNATAPAAGHGGGNIVINVTGNMTHEFIKKNIVDTIQRAANYGFGGFKYNSGFTTGNSVIAFN
jgi:hypothetical protein